MAEEELHRRQMGSFLLSTPYAFQRNCLCQPDKVRFLRPFHEKGLEFVNNRRFNKKLMLWPRGHLKTHLITQGESVREAIADPNIRILINGSNSVIGKSFLSAIRGHLLDERITNLYGDLVPKKTGKNFKDNEFELTLATRTNFTLKEPTFTASGLDKTKTSQHYDLIIHDDLVCRENIGTFEAMDTVWKVWQDSMDLLEPGGRMIIIGTRWHPLDLYGRIISDYCDQRCVAANFQHVDDCRCSFDVSILEIKDAEGGYIFDSKFNDEIADELLAIKGRLEFSAQYLNNPHDAAICWFNHERLKECECDQEEIDKVRDKLVWYHAIDPAESLESRASYSASAAVGVDHETGMWYVDYAKQAKVDTSGFLDLVWEARGLYPIWHFGMEQNTRKALDYCIRERQARLNDFFQIEELKPMLGRTPNAKQERIRRLIPMVDNRRIRINRKLRDLLNILYTLPNATSWDLADALSYIMDMVPKGLGARPVSRDSMPLKHTFKKAYTYAIRRKRPNARVQGPHRSVRISQTP